jgi:hypothetical protein
VRPGSVPIKKYIKIPHVLAEISHFVLPSQSGNGYVKVVWIYEKKIEFTKSLLRFTKGLFGFIKSLLGVSAKKRGKISRKGRTQACVESLARAACMRFYAFEEQGHTTHTAVSITNALPS